MSSTGFFPEEVVVNRTIEDFHTYFERRGFNQDDIRQLGMELVTGKTMADELKWDHVRPGLYAIRIQYPDTDYFSFRILNPGKGNKATGPSGAKPHCYIPENINWGEFGESDTLYLAESPLKAAALCKHGHYAIAGSGVDGLYNRHGFSVNFPHHLITPAKEVVVLFDSDIHDNANVIGASQRLAAGMAAEYPNRHMLLKSLPRPRGGTDHWGIDDAIVSLGAEWLNDWLGGEQDTSPLELEGRGKELAALNALYAVCEFPAGIVELANGRHFDTAKFHNTLETDRMYRDVDGASKSASRAWVSWAGRNRVKEMRYAPGRDEGFIQGEFYNTWRDDGVYPQEGDVEPFLELLRNNIPESEATLLLDMISWCLQNRGQRCEKTVVFISTELSTGKSTMLNILRELYGPSNSMALSAGVFTGRFNGSFAGKELVCIDEVQKLDAEAMAKLERYTTDKMVDHEAKNRDVKMVENNTTFYLTSNRPGCLTMKDNDRRFFIVHFDPDVYHGQGDPYWDDLYDYLGVQDGYAKIRNYLMTRDVSAFNPHFMPPLNAMKRHMMSSGGNDYEEFARMLKHHPEEVLGDIPEGRLYFCAEELELLRVGHNYNGDARLLTNAARCLGKQGLQQYFMKPLGDRQLRVRLNGESKVKSPWSIRGNLLATAAEIQDNIKIHPIEFDHYGELAKKKKF